MITKELIETTIEKYRTPYMKESKILETDMAGRKTWDVTIKFNCKYHHGNSFEAHIETISDLIILEMKIQEIKLTYVKSIPVRQVLNIFMRIRHWWMKLNLY